MQDNSIKALFEKYKRMPYGVIPKVAKRCGVSNSYVSAVRRGQRKNNKVLAALIWELENIKREEEEIKERIEKL